MSATVSTAALVKTRSVALGSLWQIPLGEGRVFTVGDLRTGCAIGHDCPPIGTYRVSVDAYGDIHLHLE